MSGLLLLVASIAMACSPGAVQPPRLNWGFSAPSPSPPPPSHFDTKYRGDRNGFASRSLVLPKLTPAGQAALLQLGNADVFTSSRIGFSGALSPHAAAFRTILAEPAALAAFTELADSEQPEPKLYGLAGLYLGKNILDSPEVFPYTLRMDSINGAPESLVEAVRYFEDPAVCLAFLASVRWPNGVACPRCSERNVSFLSTRKLWKCKGCKKQFSVKVGTIFEDSPIGLDKWLPAVWMVVNCKNGISSYELGRALGVTQKSAWFMNHRIRLALQSGHGLEKMNGEVEADETFIGGAVRFMHKGRRARMIKGRGPVGKVAVMGLLQRHGEGGHSEVRAAVVPDRRKASIKRMIYANVTPGAELFTDELASYNDAAQDYCHKVINHAESYAEGKIHTNGLENFWSLLKRSIKGTYVSVEPFHLFRYLDEQSFRFNHRKANDGSRFMRALCGIVGRRITYQRLIGEVGAT